MNGNAILAWNIGRMFGLYQGGDSGQKQLQKPLITKKIGGHWRRLTWKVVVLGVFDWKNVGGNFHYFNLKNAGVFSCVIPVR